MNHSLIPKIIEFAKPIALQLNLEVVGVTFHTNKRPPVLRVDVRSPSADTSLDDCERMSQALSGQLDGSTILDGAYVLEISSPGISPQLKTDREFITFKGFEVIVKTLTLYKSSQAEDPPLPPLSSPLGLRGGFWRGKLLSRDEEAVYLNQKGKTISIPRQLVASVQLDDGSL